ncbi:MAG TPA: cupin domain-containing protein [Sphingopyxis sp.]|nr:cupin domain-containing protein [Sphingopyxis sp.]HMP44710.1 cupin domain-containing protein [Sphingopyxis sp.]HMQ18708.1 cupin domain-containing protein [Sphingopyxis sp.]
MTTHAHRRIVTGLDADGRSCILFDGPGGAVTEMGGTRVTALWQTGGAPADNSGTADAAQAFSFAFARGGSKFLIVEFVPSDDLVGPGMHATDTLDYGILLSGRIDLLTETGETELAPGDLVVDRGILHGWRNRGPEVARMLFVNIDALPVGDGATVG